MFYNEKHQKYIEMRCEFETEKQKRTKYIQTTLEGRTDMTKQNAYGTSEFLVFFYSFLKASTECFMTEGGQFQREGATSAEARSPFSFRWHLGTARRSRSEDLPYLSDLTVTRGHCTSHVSGWASPYRGFTGDRGTIFEISSTLIKTRDTSSTENVLPR